MVTYFGNKWWTFAHKKGGNPRREYLLYAIFNVVAIGLQLGCLGFSRYVLDLSSPLSDNISGTLIGQIVAVVFRYWVYDKFVFVEHDRTYQLIVSESQLARSTPPPEIGQMASPTDILAAAATAPEPAPSDKDLRGNHHGSVGCPGRDRNRE